MKPPRPVVQISSDGGIERHHRLTNAQALTLLMLVPESIRAPDLDAMVKARGWPNTTVAWLEEWELVRKADGRVNLTKIGEHAAAVYSLYLKKRAAT